MQCPKCQTDTLQSAALDELIPCQICKSCEGVWLMLEDYLNHKNQLQVSDASSEGVVVESGETRSALLCPVTGTLMLKFRISKDTDHRLDLSPKINGIWMDKGEWELLKAHGLAGKLNTIFTDVWQRQIRESAAKEQFDELYLERFGESDYQKIKSIREWLHQHPQKDRLKAFLLADDPWSAIK
ncbi:zf-TFIIB domain-containing protein [Budviciaceae bacterium BWR-B9]|uniref:Zf-TFIIB domain-containing protein n=1 Tax=Limnobaculum allomyrinae TaxID=2791986 RepID=A0ABS1IVF4_9GAMM|nr:MULTISPECIES: zf-TFIIB domain-containing protein [Limnobaculum]MBK5145739.1 zf-TFIIB domain-containing protein [Limnobaculum allomyrinae]MBV7693727.1 zf-TFIIB domain-containing protein [Limnobaculum sp. M2-1]